MDEVKEIYTVTLALIKLLESSSAQDRTEKIMKMEELLNQREELIKFIKPPYTEQEKEIGTKLIKLEPILTGLLEDEKLSIQKDLKDLTIKRDTTNKYVNPYDSFSPDGVFYDKRN